MTQGPSAGWFDDPAGSGGERWWDGQAWTDAVRAKPQDPSLADLPPPATPPAGDAPSPRRPRRRLLIGAVIVVPLLVAAGAAILLLATGQSSVAAAEGRLPDLTDPPEVTWTLDLHDQFELVSNDLLDDDRWQWLADEARSDPQGLVRDYGSLITWDAGQGRAVILPTIDQIGNRLHGIDTTSGELIWSADPLSLDGDGSGWLTCTGLETTHIACVASHWDQHTDVTTSELYLVDTTNGTVTADADVGRRGGSAYLTGQGTDAALVVTHDGSTTMLTRYDTQAEELWSIPFDGPGDVRARSLGDLLQVTSYDHEGGSWTQVLDADSGEPAAGFEQGRPRDDLDVDYLDWGGEPLRLEHDTRTSRRSISMLDGEQERWWFTSDARLLSSSHVEAGAPVLLHDSDTQAVSAIDPETGDERWSYRSRSSWPSLVLATRSQVVLRDETTILSFDAATGDIEWRREADDGPSLRVGGSTLYEVTDGYRVRAIELEDGEERWSFTAPLRTDRAALQEVGGRLALVSAEGIQALQ